MNFKIGDRVILTPRTDRKGNYQRDYLLRSGRVSRILESSYSPFHFDVVVKFDIAGTQHCCFDDLTQEIINGWTE